MDVLQEEERADCESHCGYIGSRRSKKGVKKRTNPPPSKKKNYLLSHPGNSFTFYTKLWPLGVIGHRLIQQQGNVPNASLLFELVTLDGLFGRTGAGGAGAPSGALWNLTVPRSKGPLYLITLFGRSVIAPCIFVKHARSFLTFCSPLIELCPKWVTACRNMLSWTERERHLRGFIACFPPPLLTSGHPQHHPLLISPSTNEKLFPKSHLNSCRQLR